MPSVNHAAAGAVEAGLDARAGTPPRTDSLEYELKFVLPASRSAFVRRWIESSVPPDRVYPPARVVTVYYDTRDLSLLHEKVNSTYLKSKVRVRWYAGPAGEATGSPVFAECKYRMGSSRRKLRVRLPVSVADVETWPLDRQDWTALLRPLRAEADVPSDLAPVLRLRYLRCRYADRSGARVTLDDDIRVEATNPARLAVRAVPSPLSSAAFEYKGALSELPPHLAAIVRFGGRRGSYSKYLACYQHVVRGAV